MDRLTFAYFSMEFALDLVREVLGDERTDFLIAAQEDSQAGWTTPAYLWGEGTPKR